MYQKLLTSTYKSIWKESLLYTLFPCPNGLVHAILSPMKSWITYTLIRPRIGPHLVLWDPQGSFLHNPQTTTRTRKVLVFWSPFDWIVSQVYPKGGNSFKTPIASTPSKPFSSSFSPYSGYIVNPSQLCYTRLIRGFGNQHQCQRTPTNEWSTLYTN